jgi:hypothetical protein
MLDATTYSHYYRLEDAEVAGQAPLSFAFAPLFGQGEPQTGPAVIFLEMCEVVGDPREGGQVTVVSNTAAALVHVAPR